MHNIFIMLRIKEIRERKNITQDDLSELSGVKKRSLVDYENNKIDIPLSKLQNIAIALNVSVSELIGESVKEVIANPVVSNRKTQDAVYEAQRVPVFNLEAAMSLVPLVNGDSIDEEKVIDYISIPMMPACDGAIYASGDSMYPLLKSGDMVAYKRIEVNLNNIFFGEIYLLAIKIDEFETMKTIKFVHPSELGDEYIKIVSHNQHHAPRDIKLSQITAIALVRASIRIHN